MTTGCNISDSHSQPGYVYFVREGMKGPIKIGFAADPKRRLAELQCGCARALRFIGLTPGSMADERQWHERFRSLRIGGEWFRAGSQLLDAIKVLPVIDMPHGVRDRGSVAVKANDPRRQLMRQMRSLPDPTFEEVRAAMINAEKMHGSAAA